MVNGEDLARMVRHWLSTPPNGYLGSSYGCDPKALLQLPNADGMGDAFIDKMLIDIPLLRQLPRGSVNVYFQQRTKDTKRLIIEVGDISINYDEIQTQ